MQRSGKLFRLRDGRFQPISANWSGHINKLFVDSKGRLWITSTESGLGLVADPTAAEIKLAGHSTVGLLGTRFTMEQAFYRDRLSERHGLRVIVPDAKDRETVHRIIYDELCVGVISEASRSEYRRVMAGLASQGARAIILGCTEISLLVNQQDSRVPLFDTTAIHARAAAEEALVP